MRGDDDLQEGMFSYIPQQSVEQECGSTLFGSHYKTGSDT
jgi:hypothetical protein